MDSSESISLAMDTTTDSIDVVGHFKHDTKQLSDHGSNQNQPPIFKKHRQKRPRTILVNGKKLDYHEEETISNKLPPDKRYCIVDETPPSSTSSTTATTDCSPYKPHLSHHNNNHHSELPTSPAASSLATFLSCCSEASSSSSSSSAIALHKRRETLFETREINPSQGKKSVLFDKVTVYHFRRSQGFTSVPTDGGVTLGMKRKHFLRRRVSVDLYEEARRRFRRQILLKIHIEKRKQVEQSQQQRAQTNRIKVNSPSSSQTNTPDSDDDTRDRADVGESNRGHQIDGESDTKVIDVVSVDNSNDDEDDEETYSDYSDISDSELESDSYLFLQKPLDVKLRRSLLKESGVGRIDPREKKECNKIRDSRERSGCKCVGQCIPEYCECSRLGVRCHVDRASFPCGCNSEGCKNPEGRTEFDKGRVRRHFIEKIMETHSQLSTDEDELTATTPPSSTTSGESC